MLDIGEATWAWRGPSIGTTSDGYLRFRTVRQTLRDGSYRNFSLGDVIILSRLGDAYENPRAALEPENVYAAQIVRFYEDGGEESDDEYATAPYEHLKLVFRWFYYWADPQADQEAVDNREMKSVELEASDFFYSDFVDTTEINSVTCVIGRALLGKSVEEGRELKRKLKEEAKAGRIARKDAGGGVRITASENDGVYLCRWFYKTDANFQDHRLRWLPKGALDWLLQCTSMRTDTFEKAMRFKEDGEGKRVGKITEVPQRDAGDESRKRKSDAVPRKSPDIASRRLSDTQARHSTTPPGHIPRDLLPKRARAARPAPSSLHKLGTVLAPANPSMRSRHPVEAALPEKAASSDILRRRLSGGLAPPEEGQRKSGAMARGAVGSAAAASSPRDRAARPFASPKPEAANARAAPRGRTASPGTRPGVGGHVRMKGSALPEDEMRLTAQAGKARASLSLTADGARRKRMRQGDEEGPAQVGKKSRVERGGQAGAGREGRSRDERTAPVPKKKKRLDASAQAVRNALNAEAPARVLKERREREEKREADKKERETSRERQILAGKAKEDREKEVKTKAVGAKEDMPNESSKNAREVAEAGRLAEVARLAELARLAVEAADRAAKIRDDFAEAARVAKARAAEKSDAAELGRRRLKDNRFGGRSAHPHAAGLDSSAGPPLHRPPIPAEGTSVSRFSPAGVASSPAPRASAVPAAPTMTEALPPKSMFDGLAPLLARMGGSKALGDVEKIYASICDAVKTLQGQEGGLDAWRANPEALRQKLLEMTRPVPAANNVAGSSSGNGATTSGPSAEGKPDLGPSGA